MSFLNKYVEIKEKLTGGSRTYYGYVLAETFEEYEVSCDGQILAISKIDKKIKVSLIEYCPELTPFISHEALHTTSIVMDLISHSLLEHWYAISDPEFYKLVEEAQSKLFDAYQLVGNKSL